MYVCKLIPTTPNHHSHRCATTTPTHHAQRCVQQQIDILERELKEAKRSTAIQQFTLDQHRKVGCGIDSLAYQIRQCNVVVRSLYLSMRNDVVVYSHMLGSDTCYVCSTNSSCFCGIRHGYVHIQDNAELTLKITALDHEVSEFNIDTEAWIKIAK